MRRVRIGIDTGGTFTDVVALDEDSGRLTVTKTPSTPADPAVGFMAGVDKVLGAVDADGGVRVTSVCHGTTVATNALLEDDIGRLGLITTTGYRAILEIARQSVPDGYGNSYFWVKPDRIVPLDRVQEVGGRIDAGGRQLAPFDEQRAVEVARWFRDRDVDTIGVCLIHAYADDTHERRMGEVLAREHPAAVVSLSCEVLREYREYERTVTTLVDAAVKPRVASYVGDIAGRIDALARRQDQPVSFHVMRSNGGLISATELVRQPIATVLSGPAAGALGAALVAREAGHDRILTCDGGGTSTDVAVVIDGEPTITTEGTVGRFPSRIPMVDVVTVGAGGGSVAWVSPEGALKVGPRSAGADPGPACYGTGGSEPTVTDAHLVLGRIPDRLLGGEIPLEPAAAEQALRHLGDELGLTLNQTSRGVLEVSAWNQANAIRQVTTKRGLDVRDFALVAFGGSGPLLACRLVDLLGLRAAIVPRDPGNLSAFGLLTVDVRNDGVQTHVVADEALDLDELAAVYRDLERDADHALDREGFASADRRIVRSADLRYDGQASEVRVAVPDGPIDDALRAVVVAAFHAEHERLYGYAYRDGQGRHRVEWVNLRVTGVGPIARPALERLATSDGEVGRARTGTRPVVFDDEPIEVPLFDRALLLAGDRVAGPAVIEEFGSTLPLHPGFVARVDTLGNLVVTTTEAEVAA